MCRTSRASIHGLHRDLCEAMTRDAGFTSFTVHDLDDPANLYYEVRP